MLRTFLRLGQSDAELEKAVCECVKHLQFARERLDFFAVAFLTNCQNLHLPFLQILVVSKKLLVFVLHFFHSALDRVDFGRGFLQGSPQLGRLGLLLLKTRLQLSMLPHQRLIFLADGVEVADLHCTRGLRSRLEVDLR